MLLRLYTLLLVLVVASASWAAFGAGGGAGVSIILLALAIHVWAGKSRWRRPLRLAAAVLWLPALVCLLLPLMNDAREAARCVQCRNNLRQIAVALRNYWDSDGSYPPAVTRDDTGRPMPSWRLLIMPYLDCSGTYDAYKLEEAWNSPSNRRLLAKRP